MPELPEIEVIRRTLAPVLRGASLRVTHVGPHDMRARGEGRGVRRRGPWMGAHELLDGARVARLERRGKRLGIVAVDGRCLVVQLGMSGWIVAGRERARAAANASHVHVRWLATRGDSVWTVRFGDPRRFGGLTAYPDERAMLAAWDDELGPDALDIGATGLGAALRGGRAVKSALLDQRAIAGIGNIYADESLHLAGIDPRTRCGRIRPEGIARLAASVRTVLGRAVRTGGSTLRDYRSGRGASGHAQLLHAVYGRGGEPCLSCGSPIAETRLGGRTTAWCRGCQPPGSGRRARQGSGKIKD